MLPDNSYDMFLSYNHSVVSEVDFKSPYIALFLGALWQLQVSIDAVCADWDASFMVEDGHFHEWINHQKTDGIVSRFGCDPEFTDHVLCAERPMDSSHLFEPARDL